jgi:hypothetical protein
MSGSEQRQRGAAYRAMVSTFQSHGRFSGCENGSNGRPDTYQESDDGKLSSL